MESHLKKKIKKNPVQDIVAAHFFVSIKNSLSWVLMALTCLALDLTIHIENPSEEGKTFPKLLLL